MDFGSAYAGRQERTLDVFVVNDGRTTDGLQWFEVAAPFSLVSPPTLVEPGTTLVTVKFSPTAAGRLRSMLKVQAADQPAVEIALTGVGLPVPECKPSNSCTTARFDADKGECVEEPLTDGLSCDTGSVCVVSGVCQSGRCVGVEQTCDDQNACTLDVCNATLGCEHLPAPPCPGDGVCQVGVCNPATGCGMAAATDGTACGPTQTCDAAQVCISGACVVRNPPDGYVCAEASPCQGEGRCAGSICARPAAVTLKPAWSFDALATGNPDAGVAPDELHDLVVEPSGAVSLMGFFTEPRLRANLPGALSAPTPARRCMLWNNRLVCADYPYNNGQYGKISGIDLATGNLAWTFDIATARPDLKALTSSLFLGRLAVQGPDRLAALYEAGPKGNVSKECRSYFLVVLDGAGKLVGAQQVKDPVLDVCNHPHPYGFGSDALGNLFISFSPTIGTPAPLIPGSPTVVMSFTRDGVFRWKFTDMNLTGGELAIATGLIYPENSAISLHTSTGAPAFSLKYDFGRAVVSRTRTIPAPMFGGQNLSGYEAGVNAQRWSFQLDAPKSFWSDQIRLASWKTSQGPKTVALTFTRDGSGKTFLQGNDATAGNLAFSCQLEVPMRGAPQLFEIANGSIALMEGSPACGKCDPPFASSSAAFHTVKTPLLEVADEPWTGTFGGSGHSHHEAPVVQPPTVTQ